MARIHRYVAHDGSWTETITDAIRIGDTSGGEAGERTLPAAANAGAVSSIEISIDDVDSTVGHAGDGIVGLQRWEIDEDAAPAGNQRLWTGITDDRDYSTSPVLEAVGANVDISLKASDLNALLSFRRFAPDDTDANRPEETCQERFDAVMGSDLAAGLLVASATLVEIPDKGMAANKYYGSTLGDVLGDIAIQAGGLNHFVRHNETDDVDEVCIFEPNRSTLYESSFKISNVDADIDDDDPDTQTTFAPDPTPGRTKLTRSPAKVGSRIDIPWSKGTERYVRAATEDDFYRRDLQAPNATVKSAAKALDIGEDFAWKARGEDDVIDCTVPVPAAHVNDAREGQRIQVKFRHFRGYTDWRWVRIVERDPVPWAGSEAGYDVHYKLVPQGTQPPAGKILQYAVGHTADGGGTLTLPDPVTIGSTLVFTISASHANNPAAPNTSVALPRWGAGAWTKDPNVTVKNGYGTGEGQGIAIWTKPADSVEQTGYVGSAAAAIAIYELADVDLSSATTVHVTDQAAANPMTAGAFASATDGSVAILVGNWADSSFWDPGDPPPAEPTWTGTVNGWTLDHIYRIPGVYPRWGPPVSYIAHALADGSTLTASGTRSGLQWLPGQWAAAAILLPPA